MKIYSFSTVKDESDIIESFVRYNMNILDGMVISDNSSNDNTLEILKKMKKEGYNIEILEDKSQYFDQDKKRRFLFDYVKDKYDPDFIFPLDGDEFIATYGDQNPRKIIETLDQDHLYQYKMNNYVVNDKTGDIDGFIPEQMKYLRTDVSKDLANYKSFISRKIAKRDLTLYTGCHTVKYADGSDIDTIFLDDIFIAHYPIRNKSQLMNKVITGRLNNLSLHSRKEGSGIHQYKILDEIIKDNNISNKTLYDISKYYGILDKDTVKKIINKPISISFCKKIKMKYKELSQINVLSNTLKTSETIISHMRESLKEKNDDYISIADEHNKLCNDYNKLTGQYNENMAKLSDKEKELTEVKEKMALLEKDYKEAINSIEQQNVEIQNMQNEINMMINSKSWRITKPLRSVTKKVSNLKSKKND